MSRNNRRRRSAQQRTQLHHHTPRTHDETQRESTYDLIRAGITAAFGPTSDLRVLDRVVEQLVRREAAGADPVFTAGQFLDSSIDHAFSIGWQPAELIHALRRELGPPTGRLVAALVSSHASRTSARLHAPPAWVDQLDGLELTPTVLGSEVLVRWRTTENLRNAKGWKIALTLMGRVSRLGSLPRLITPPSDWGSTGTPRTAKPESKVLNTIRGLLAKAEATAYPAEAEALSAKAQDLMTRYAIDHAVLDAQEHTSLSDLVSSRRILVDNPYPEAKVALLQSVSTANSVRTIWLQTYGLVTLVGMPVDLDLCDLLFTSLLVQSSLALKETGRDRDSRSTSFRRSFLLAYASRIGERLMNAREQATRAASDDHGTAVVPIMAERAEAIGNVFDEMFPRTTPVAHSITNPSGWVAGLVAAETADITGGRDKIDR